MKISARTQKRFEHLIRNDHQVNLIWRMSGLSVQDFSAQYGSHLKKIVLNDILRIRHRRKRRESVRLS